MIRTFTIACAALVISTLAAFAGEPEGRYSVVGSNPGNGSRYSGTVMVEKTGQTYKVTWNIGGEIYVGTGIGSSEGLAVSYRSGNQSGLAIYGAKGKTGKASGPGPTAAPSAAKPGPGNNPPRNAPITAFCGQIGRAHV